MCSLWFQFGIILSVHLRVKAGLCPSTGHHGLSDELGLWGRGRGSVGWFVARMVEVKEFDSNM